MLLIQTQLFRVKVFKIAATPLASSGIDARRKGDIKTHMYASPHPPKQVDDRKFQDVLQFNRIMLLPSDYESADTPVVYPELPRYL